MLLLLYKTLGLSVSSLIFSLENPRITNHLIVPFYVLPKENEFPGIS